MPRDHSSPAPAAEADPIDVAVGARLRLQRQARRMSQQELARRLGVTFQQVQKYERAFNRISASMLVRAAEALGCSPMVLIAGDPEQSAASDALWMSLLTQPGARELLTAFTHIEDPAARTALVSIAKGLAATPKPQACKG